MDIVSQCRFRTSGFVWKASSGTWAMTIIVKATFDLKAGATTVAAEQEPIHDSDKLGHEAFAKSLYAPSDRVPYKPRADVLLVGHAYAPGKQPARSVTTRLVVGDRLDKSIEVWCDRGFQVQTGQLLEGPRITKMPLTWERTTGDTMNPVGMRFDAAPNSYGMIAIPNLQPVGLTIAKRSDTFGPIAYAPVAATWPVRTQRLGQLAGSFPRDGWEKQPMPSGVDPSYFQAAPADQQIAPIRPDEQIVLENLHPEHARIVTSLPGLQPKAVVERATGERDAITLLADTLWIDTDRGVCCVVWRGWTSLRDADEPGRIVVSIEGENAPVEELDADVLQSIPPPPVDEPAVAQSNVAETFAIGIDLSKLPGPAMPFTGADKPPVAAPSRPATRPGDDALPFGAGGAPGRPAQPVAPVVGPGTMFVPTMPAEAPGAPAGPLAMPVMAPAMPAMVAPVVSVPEPPPWTTSKESVPRPTLGQMMAQAQLEAPKQAAPGPVVAMSSVKGEAEPSPVIDEAAAKRGWKPVDPKGSDTNKGPPLSPNPVIGAVAASDAAAIAERSKRSPERQKHAPAVNIPPPKAVIELLWHDPAAMPRIRKIPGWKEILGHIKGKAFEDELGGDATPEQRQQARDRRDVAGLLARGDAIEMAGIQSALANAVSEDGTFVPPLVLVAGDLEFPFDELETLKATMAALTPLASGDKALKEQLDTTEELLKTPWLKGASGIAEGLTAKLKEVFGRGNRVLPPRYLEGHTERMLLEQRAYQKRTVLGKTCIRSLLHLPGAQGGVPVYLAEALGQELPAFQRFAVRMIGEVRGKVDQYVSVRSLA